MSILLHGDCLEEMKGLDDNSIDLIFCDLPYGQTSCKWDCCIDLEKFWIEVMRIKKLNTPIFMTTTTKFGVSLINSAPKKCHFRFDLVWVKSSPAGFLSAKKMPMRKHEMIYVFYEKLPFYDLSSHTHKFIKEEKILRTDGGCDGLYGKETGKVMIKDKDGKIRNAEPRYDPPLPVSVIKEELCKYDVNKNTYGGGKEGRIKISKDKKDHQQKYDPPLPVSVVKEEMTGGATGEEPKYKLVDLKKSDIYGDKLKVGKIRDRKDRKEIYDPPLPVSVIKEEKTQISKCKDKDLYGDMKGGTIGNVHGTNYEPPLPTTIVKEDVYDANERFKSGKLTKHPRHLQKGDEPLYDPPLPNSMLEIKSTRGKHSTEKPVALMEWVLKYYSKEGDVVLDPTMGSGSTGVACKNMNRNFIGIEKDPEIYEVAVNRIEE